MSLMYLEDFQPGQTFDLGSIHVTHDQVVDFAQQFDPQPFHLDIDAGGQSIFGGLIASGWHTCSLMMRLVVDNLFSRTATLGSPGVNQIRWMLPVRPGDTLKASTRVLAVTSSVSKPDRGTIEFHYEVRNQNDQQVLAMQRQIADLQAEQKRTLAAMNTLRQDLQAARERAAETGGSSSTWVLGLSLLSLALAASSLLLWRSNRMQRREAEQHWLTDSRQDAEAEMRGVATVPPPMPTGPSPFTPTDPHSSPAPLMSHLSTDGPPASSAPTTIPMPLTAVEEPTRPGPLTPPPARASTRAPTTAADDALEALAALEAMEAVEPLSLQFDRDDTRPAPFTADLGGVGSLVTVEELIDLEQQVDFFMVLGQDDAAIELLSSRLNQRDAASGLPFLKLMELYQRRGDREAFDRVGARFAEQFHARAPSWSDDLNEGEGLEAHDELIDRLEAAWVDAEGSMSLLQDLLSKHQEYSGDLGLPAYRDLLLLYAVARDRAEHEVDGQSIDVVLPLDATAHADQMATMVWQSPPPPPGMPAPRSVLTQSVDLDLSLVDDEPPRDAKGR